MVKPPVSGLAITSPKSGDIVDPSVMVTGTGLPRTGLPGSVIVYQGTTELATAPLDTSGNFSVLVSLIGAGSQPLSISQVASSLSGAGSAESDQTTPINVVVRPPAPVIRSPLTGSTQESLSVSITGSAVPGAVVTLAIDGVSQSPVSADSNGNFAATMSMSTGTHQLVAIQTIDGATGPACAAVLLTLGDVTPPALTVTDAQGLPLREIVSVAPDQTGIAVDFSADVNATDDGSSLTPTCLPPSGSVFQLGSTTVTCDAVDAAGNRGSTSFLVTVKTTAAPVISGSNLTAEAQGSDGATVSYQVGATGFIADCAPPGSPVVQPCSSWHPAYKGLGFTPEMFAQDPNDGTIYAGVTGWGNDAAADTATAHLLKSTDGGANWTDLPSPGTGEVLQVALGGGSPAAIYIATADYHGIRISHDGGETWTSALDGLWIGGGNTDGLWNGIWIDPADPLHAFASASRTSGALYETHDDWATWTQVGDGLPPFCNGLAMDPLNPERVYASVQEEPGEVIKTKLYRRVGNAPWERLSVPPYLPALTYRAYGLTVAPQLELCQGLPGQTCSTCPAGQGQPGGSCQTYPTIFGGTVMSRDGGDTWAQLNPGSNDPMFTMSFYKPDPQIVYATTFVAHTLYRSEDSGQTWAPTSATIAPPFGPLVVDFRDSQTLYASSRAEVLGSGIYKTTDSGQTWTPLAAPGISLTGAAVKDVAVDPVDPNVAYLVANRGNVFKTTDGGDTWVSSNQGFDDLYAVQNASKIAVDPFNRNNVYLGRSGLWQSPDGAQHWTDLGAHLPLVGGPLPIENPSNFALSPSTSGSLLAMGSAVTTDSSSEISFAEINWASSRPASSASVF